MRSAISLDRDAPLDSSRFTTFTQAIKSKVPVAPIKMISVAGLGAIPLGCFFTVHYGGFIAGHLVFILALTDPSGPFEGGSFGPFDGFTDSLTPGFIAAVAALFVSHGVSFVQHFVRGDERPKDPSKLMGAPYIRIVVMHIAIIFGAGLTIALGTGTAMLVLLVVLKIAVDLWAHLREHRKAAERLNR